MSGLPADFFGPITGTWWAPKGGGASVSVNGWSMPGQICRLSDGQSLRLFDLFARYDFIGHTPHVGAHREPPFAATTDLPDLVAKARSYAARDIINDMASAICSAGGRSWRNAPKARKDRYRAMARAGLEAIRVADPAIIAASTCLAEPLNPSDAVVGAIAAALLSKGWSEDALAVMARVWRSQVDAILADT